jgi:hypothetical protein
VKRDNDYLRLIMFELVDDSKSSATEHTFIDCSADEQKRAYHLQLLVDKNWLSIVSEADYVKSKQPISTGGRRLASTRVFRVTNDGQDFVEAVRDDTIWARTKDGMSQIGGATLTMLKDIAVSYLKQKAAEQLGIQI